MRDHAGQRAAPPPLVVELEGMLLPAGPGWEIAVWVLRHDWRLILPFLLALLRGRPDLAQRIAARAGWHAANLPYDRELVDTIARRRGDGQRTVLLSALPAAAVRGIAAHLGLFDDVHAGVRDRRSLLESSYGGGYEHLAARRPSFAPAAMRAMRPRQWLKNLLVFAPMAAAHALAGPALLQSALAFAAFCACASSAYLLNDTLDVHDDRAHPKKRRRPIAAGHLAVPGALLLSALLVPAALLLAFVAGPLLAAVVLLYFVATVSYSAWLKRLAMIDIVTLAVLYCLRIIAGGAATGIEPSFWLLAFSFFLFLSLALLKRHSELFNLEARGHASTPGRGYRIADRQLIAMMGVNSAFLSVLIVILYFNSDNVLKLYSQPAWLLPIVPTLVLWLGRLWMLSFRGRIHEDPLLFVSRDKASLAIIALCAALCTLASRMS